MKLTVASVVVGFGLGLAATRLGAPPERPAPTVTPAPAPVVPPTQKASSGEDCADEVSWLQGELLQHGATPMPWLAASSPEDHQAELSVTLDSITQRHPGTMSGGNDCRETPCISVLLVSADAWPNPDLIVDLNRTFGSGFSRKVVALPDRVILLTAPEHDLGEDVDARVVQRMADAAAQIRKGAP